MRAWRASGGYGGFTCRSRLAADTLPPTRIEDGAFGLRLVRPEEEAEAERRGRQTAQNATQHAAAGTTRERRQGRRQERLRKAGLPLP